MLESVLITEISASELSRKLAKSALLVGQQQQGCNKKEVYCPLKKERKKKQEPEYSRGPIYALVQYSQEGKRETSD